MDYSQFHKIADEFLQNLADDIERKIPSAEVEYLQGVLCIEIDKKEYVFNKHEPTRQIWLSSPISGANKFFYDPTNNWVSTNGQNLLDIINQEFWRA